MATRESQGAYTDLRSLMLLEHKATGFSFLPRQPIHGVLSGRHASRLRGRGLNFEEIRGYLPGDDVRNIDWKVTARMRRPFVRVYTEERDRPVLLVVDQRRSMFFGSRRAMKSVAAAEAAALAAWRVLSVGDRVGAIVFDDEDIVEIGPHRSRQRVIDILSAIVEKNRKLAPSPRRSPESGILDRVVRRTCRIATHDHLVVLISDLKGLSEETVRSATSLTEHNDMIACFVYDPLEGEIADIGRAVLSGGELQIEVDTSAPGLRSRLRGDFEERVAHVQRISRQRATPVLMISTHDEVAEQVRAQIGRAQEGRRAP